MIYNGTPTNGKCTTNITYIGTSYFNSNHLDNAYIGYMYGTASSTTYEATHANINTSNIKSFIDNWYTTNLKTYSSKINDTLFCDDRTVKSGDGIGTNTTIYSAQLRKNNPILTCSQQNDRFTVSDTKVGNGKLTNPIGLITFDEVDMSGSNGNLTPNNLYYLYSNYDYWTITPYMYVGAEASQFYVKKDGDVGNTYGAQSQYNIRPVINLKSDVEYVSGDGTKNTPYQIS